jgi:hypothetical protein
MAKYSALLGQRVDVRYRAGEIVLPATGRLVADSGRSIFLEDRFLRGNRNCTFRWEIPYECILQVTESLDPGATGETPPAGEEPSRPATLRSLFSFRKRPRET